MQTATFPIVLATAASRDVTVGYQTQDGTGVAHIDYSPAAGSVTIPAGQTQTAVQVTVRDADPTVRQVAFGLHLTARNGAAVSRATAQCVLPGWIGLLDGLAIADGNAAPFVPGLIGVANG